MSASDEAIKDANLTFEGEKIKYRSVLIYLYRVYMLEAVYLILVVLLIVWTRLISMIILTLIEC
jgi:hypothetical protein